MQRNPVIRWAREPYSSASCPGQKLQNAIGSGFSGGLGPDQSTSKRYYRGLLRRRCELRRTESRLFSFPESDSPLAKLYPVDVVRHCQRFSIQQSDSISGQSHAALFCEPYSSRVGRFEPDAQRVHLVRAATKHNARVVQITAGWSAFSFHPGFTAREEIPLRFHVLSSAVYTIQPERPLDNGEYLVIFGPSALSGFEFQTACSGAPRD